MQESRKLQSSYLKHGENWGLARKVILHKHTVACVNVHACPTHTHTHHYSANYGIKKIIKYEIFCSSNLTSDQSLNCSPKVIKNTSLNTLVVIFLVPGMTWTLKICQIAIFPHIIYVLLLAENEVISHSVLTIKVIPKPGSSVFFLFLFAQIGFEKCMWVSQLLLRQSWFPIKAGIVIWGSGQPYMVRRETDVCAQLLVFKDRIQM